MTTRPRPFAQRVAAELRAELARQDKSGRWLAEQIGWSPATVARWIGGDTDPDLDGLEAMCRALGMSVADLLDAVQRNGGYEVRRECRRPVRGSDHDGGEHPAHIRARAWPLLEL